MLGNIPASRMQLGFSGRKIMVELMERCRKLLRHTVHNSNPKQIRPSGRPQNARAPFLNGKSFECILLVVTKED